MTSGERMVWAAEFVRGRGFHGDLVRAAKAARHAVMQLRAMSAGMRDGLDGDELALLDDMLSNGGDR